MFWIKKYEFLFYKNFQKLAFLSYKILFIFQSIYLQFIIIYIYLYVLIGRFFYAMNTQSMNSWKDLPVFDVLERRICQLIVYLFIYITIYHWTDPTIYLSIKPFSPLFIYFLYRSYGWFILVYQFRIKVQHFYFSFNQTKKNSQLRNHSKQTKK